MILTTAQAEAVYSAMCALNNVGMTANIEGIESTTGNVFKAYETPTSGTILVQVTSWRDPAMNRHEVYPDQAAFATAYGLQQG